MRQNYLGNKHDNRQSVDLNLYANPNRQQLAIRAIKSVLRQDYRHWEMIIVDDCSSSYQQLQQFVEELNDPRVRYTHNARIPAPARFATVPLCRRKGTTLPVLMMTMNGRQTV